MDQYSLYFHIPFCQHRCAYCDFNTYAGLEDLIPAYLRALIQEIEFVQQILGERLAVHTVFLGGGTPSLIPAPLLADLIAAIQKDFSLQPEAEITLEANPGTLSLEYLVDLVKIGFNRLSLGMQSANSLELAFLERGHDFSDVIRGLTWANQAGFRNINLDLIYGLPGQDLHSWQRSLESAIELHPQHLALYALTLEHGTPMYHWAQRGLISEPDPDQAADLYEWSQERLAQAGFQQYEISNWARLNPDGGSFACRHNLQYWRSDPYLGFGAGAHGFAGGIRTMNVLSPKQYIARLNAGEPKNDPLTFPKTPATQAAETVAHDIAMGEYMMMGMRLVERGIPATGFQQRFGKTMVEVYGEQIARLEQFGLVEWQHANTRKAALRLTQRGRLLGNVVFREFI